MHQQRGDARDLDGLIHAASGVVEQRSADALQVMIPVDGQSADDWDRCRPRPVSGQGRRRPWVADGTSRQTV
jgi:hypothetical protein